MSGDDPTELAVVRTAAETAPGAVRPRTLQTLLNGGISPKEMAAAMKKILDEAPNQKKKKP